MGVGGRGVRLPRDPGPSRGLHNVTNEVRSGWIGCEWLWVLYQCPSQIKVQRWPDFVGFRCWEMGGGCILRGDIGGRTHLQTLISSTSATPRGTVGFAAPPHHTPRSSYIALVSSLGPQVYSLGPSPSV